jgi:hypothetical protein
MAVVRHQRLLERLLGSKCDLGKKLLIAARQTPIESAASRFRFLVALRARQGVFVQPFFDRIALPISVAGHGSSPSGDPTAVVARNIARMKEAFRMVTTSVRR